MQRSYVDIRGRDADWIQLASMAGFAIARSGDCWVGYDGAGTIMITPDDSLDADDTLAQIILHELCHFCVEGPASAHQFDWGLDNTDERHVWREHAALRLQATTLSEFGLRDTLHPTTEFRGWYAAMNEGRVAVVPAVQTAAEEGARRLRAASWYPRLRQLLSALSPGP